MRIENLKVGQVLKNYKELCAVLEVKAEAGNSKKAQLKELERHVKYYKEGNKFIIDEIYKVAQEKIENRGGNNGKYTDDIEFLILSLLDKFDIEKHERVGFSKNLLFSHCGLVNNNFSLAKGNIKLFSECVDLPYQTIAECFDYTNNKLLKTLETTLNRLQRESLITWGKGYNLTFEIRGGKYMRVATTSEEKDIMSIERNIMKNMSCDNKRLVFLTGQWKEFKQQVEGELKNIYPDLSFYYDSITFNYNNEDIKERLKELDNDCTTIKSKLNSNFSKGLDETIEKRHKKASDRFGVSLDIYENYRGSDEFVNEQKEIKNRIINLDSREFVFFDTDDDNKVSVSFNPDDSRYNELKEKFEEKYSYKNNS